MNGRVPSTEVLFRIARYTGRPMEWFLEVEARGESNERNVNVNGAAGIRAVAA
jgi:hypothetical protein